MARPLCKVCNVLLLPGVIPQESDSVRVCIKCQLDRKKEDGPETEATLP
jgi:hypothetical protein